MATQPPHVEHRTKTITPIIAPSYLAEEIVAYLEMVLVPLFEQGYIPLTKPASLATINHEKRRVREPGAEAGQLPFIEFRCRRRGGRFL